MPAGFLRQLTPDQPTGQQPPPYPLSTTQEVDIGRDPNCQIVLDSDRYGSVSRHHAVVRPLATLVNGQPAWEICDRNSANGTYVNGDRLQGCQVLRVGDRITLGINGPEFIFEETPSSVPVSSSAAAKTSPPPSNSVTFTQLFPILSTGRDLTRKGYLVPAAITVLFVVLMFATLGDAALFNLLLAGYLAGAAYYVVYQLCGKHKPWWVLLSSAITTGMILLSPLLLVFLIIFRQILPGDLPEDYSQISFWQLLIAMFFGAGLMEELLKAIPILAAYFLGKILPSPWRERIGVWEPLDGILLGTASAVGFTLLETLAQYVPQIALESGDLAGLQLLIPRIVGSVAGHMAYSGYLGYFIGLSVLKPHQRWQILATGYFSASLLHALWNSMAILGYLVLAVVGVLSYAFLAAAILKARLLSPTRSQNFATRFYQKS